MPTYAFRRNLKRSDWLKAAGIGAGAGVGAALVVGYLASVFIRRTPLRDPPRVPTDPGRTPKRV